MLSKCIDDNIHNTIPRIWITLFFQILSTIESINQHYPNFVCGNIEPGKIKFQKVDHCGTSIFRYNKTKHYFIIPNIGIRIKICDFSESFYSKNKNDNHDINFFLTSMECFLEKYKSQVPMEIMEFIGRNKNRTADEILSFDPLFDKYRFN
ncbi:F10-like kinase [Tupanvirus deep ocean]|uniref:F10-like kinase n=2 Tax=Tupanvirus TaxID=2094720 RepID=A0AC62A9J5_9VIRU|nr:F10-like kinase [Tupanvirus deep ocean]QKU34318.1 F10-like kinase [Tupanvirus deep ocean]